MPKSAPLLDDLLSIGGSLFGNLVEARHELKAQARTQLNQMAQKLDLVSREEFDAAFAMVAKARAMQEELSERLARVEAHLKIASPAKKSAAKTKKRAKK